jgi:uncharacterized RDD family membrane protein YckC
VPGGPRPAVPTTPDPGHPGPVWPAQPGPYRPASGYDRQPAYAAAAHTAPPSGYSVPANAVPGYGYPPAGFRPAAQPVAPGGAPLAEFWQRLVAYIVDSVVFGVAMTVPMLLIAALLFTPYFSSLEPGRIDPVTIALLEFGLFALIVPLYIVASYVYFVRMCHKSGQTVGKRVMKIRIVRASDGGPIDLRASRRRWIVQHVSAFFAFYFSYADGLWQLWDQPHRQCLHDKCAETVVVQVTV